MSDQISFFFIRVYMEKTHAPFLNTQQKNPTTSTFLYTHIPELSKRISCIFRKDFLRMRPGNHSVRVEFICHHMETGSVPLDFNLLSINLLLVVKPTFPSFKFYLSYSFHLLTPAPTIFTITAISP